MAHTGWHYWGWEAVGTNKEDQLNVKEGEVRKLECYGKGKVAVATEVKFNEIPIWEVQCTNESCKKVHDGAVLFSNVEDALNGVKAAFWNLKKCLKDKVDIKTVYKFSCKTGAQYLYPELLEAFQELQKLMEKIEKL